MRNVEKIMRTASYSDLKQNLKAYIDSVIEDSDTVIINRGKGTGVVLMSLESTIRSRRQSTS